MKGFDMAKIQLGKAPATFKRCIKFKALDGTDCEINVEYKYRTRKEFAKFFEDFLDKEKGKAGETADKRSLTEMVETGMAEDGKFLVEMLQSWDLDEPLNTANAERLSNEFPAAAAEIIAGYRMACMEGRLGN